MNADPLWLALHLPLLALEARGPLPSFSAVAEQGSIVVCDSAASAAGVSPGCGAAAARALAPEIKLLQRDPACEVTALQSLACWAGGFTPRVSLVLPDALLLEIGGCLKLFGDLPALAAMVGAGLQAQGYSAQIAAAPTPQAALWLAQRESHALCCESAALPRLLDALPVAVLPDVAAQALQRFGACTLAEARHLPTAALARRIGAEAMRKMACAYGELPDPQLDFVFPASFQRSLELPAPVENAAALLFAAQRLTMALAGWLAQRQASMAECLLRLSHRRGETVIALRFGDATRDAERIRRVLHERLQRTQLTAPVEWLHLAATELRDLPGRSSTLFDDAAGAREAMGALFDRLRARLGEERVHALAAHADHRPECATEHAPLDTAAQERPARKYAARGVAAEKRASIAPPRPFWLLDKPQPLLEIGGQPHRQGPLKLLSRAERIESGWWDQGEASGDIRRDYFVALGSDQRWLWIFRECRLPGGWFLHGFFS